MTGGRVSESDQSGIDDPSGASRPSPDARARVLFSETYPAVAGSISTVRATVGESAAQLGASAALIDDLKLAVSEAVNNVVLHAYAEADQPGLIHVEATLAAAELSISVTDTGSGLQVGQPEPGPGLGLGLALIGQLADHVELLQGSNGGLHVLMRFALPAIPPDT